MRRYPRLFLITSALLLAGCSSPEEAPASVEVPLPVVKTLSVADVLSREFTVTGEVQAHKSAILTAALDADVTNVNVKPGDEVKKGQVLIELADAGVRARANTASDAYAIAQRNLEQSIRSAEQNVESARVSLGTAEVNLKNVLEQNERRRNEAAERLKQTEVATELSVDTAIRSAQTSVTTALQTVDELLEYSIPREDLNYLRETHIGVLDPAQKMETRDRFTELLALVRTSRGTYDDTHRILLRTEQALVMMLTVMQNSVTSREYDQDDLSRDISAISQELSAVRSDLNALEVAQKNATSGAGGVPQEVVAARATYEATLQDLDAAERNARQQLESAKLSYENAKVSAELTRLTSRSTLTNVEGELEQARINADDLTIRAPFDGRVSDVGVVVGNEVSPGDRLVAVGNTDVLKIVAYLSSDEVRNVHVGDTVKIASQSTDVVSAVAPSADPLTKKYKVEMLHENPYLAPGEFVPLTFTVNGNGAPDVPRRLLVPVTAIHLVGEETFVWTIASSGATTVVRKTPVTVGAVEGDLVQITDGLSRRDRVVTTGGRIIRKEGTAVKAQSEDASSFLPLTDDQS